MNQLNDPHGVFVDNDGNIYVADSNNHRIVKWAPSASEGVVVAGGAPYADTLCFPAVGGCMDAGACNYDALANTDDGSCTYTCASQGLDEVFVNLYDSYGDGWNGNILTVDGVDYTIACSGWSGCDSTSFSACIDLSGCISVTYNNAGSYASENSWTITDASGAVLLFGGNVGSGGTFGTCVVLGCTDTLACNYNASANTDDGSCLVAGCTDSTAFNYDCLLYTSPSPRDRG